MSGFADIALIALLCTFGLLQIAAMIEDARLMTISNGLNIVLFLLIFPVFLLGGYEWIDIAQRLGIAFGLFGLFALAFYRGMIGGGDVKLLGASLPWIAPQEILVYLFIVALLGGLLAVLVLLSRVLPDTFVQPFARLPWLQQPPPEANEGPTTSLPYGIAIGGAGLWVMANGTTFHPLQNLLAG